MESIAANRRGPYAKTALVRAQIVRAAMEVFAESGFRAGTMKEVAARAGISQRGLVHHFATKEALLQEVLGARAVESAQLVKFGAPRDVLRSVVDVVADNSLHPRLVELYSVLFAEATSPDHPAHAHHAERLDAWRSYLTTAFAELADEGALAPGLSPELAAATLVALQDGLQIQWLYDPTAIDMAKALDAYLSAIVLGYESAVSPPRR